MSCDRGRHQIENHGTSIADSPAASKAEGGQDPMGQRPQDDRKVNPGQSVIRSSDGQGLVQLWGAGFTPYNDEPVPGDYDGDGRTDIAVWRASTGVWYIVRSSDGAVVARRYGETTDIPIPRVP